MNWNILKRLDAAEKSVGVGRCAENIPELRDMISAEDRELLEPYLAAREAGDDGRDWPDETHQAMRRYLKAAVERSRMLREAGVPMESVSETLRRRHQARAAAETQAEIEQAPAGTLLP